MIQRLMIAAVFCLFMTIPSVGSDCIAFPQACSGYALATIPPGGSCVISENYCSAIARTYTASGELYDIDAIRCNPSLCF